MFEAKGLVMVIRNGLKFNEAEFDFNIIDVVVVDIVFDELGLIPLRLF